MKKICFVEIKNQIKQNIKFVMSDIIDKVLNVINKGRYAIFVLFLLCGAGTTIFAIRFISATTISLVAPEGTVSLSTIKHL